MYLMYQNKKKKERNVHPTILHQGEHVPQLTAIYKHLDIFKLMNLKKFIVYIQSIKYTKS